MPCAMRSIRSGGEKAMLQIDQLSVSYPAGGGMLTAVDAVSLQVSRGECLGVVGESGAGKSQVFLAAMGLLADNAQLSGRVRFDAVDLLGLRRPQLDRIRGARIGMLFQDPMSALT